MVVCGKVFMMAEAALLVGSSVFDRSLRKRRYNLTLYPDSVARMDHVAKELGISRSELVEYSFNKFYTEYRQFGGGAQ